MHSKEVGSGTSTTLSCAVSDITQTVSITWSSAGSPVTSGGGVTANSGELVASSQTATLGITSPDADTTYTCEVKSGALQSSEPASKSVAVFVYSKYLFTHTT